jgi:hypothetical protein
MLPFSAAMQSQVVVFSAGGTFFATVMGSFVTKPHAFYFTPRLIFLS